MTPSIKNFIEETEKGMQEIVNNHKAFARETLHHPDLNETFTNVCIDDLKSFLHARQAALVDAILEEIKSFEVPENAEIQPESQRVRKEWQNLIVKLIVERLKKL